MYTVMIVTQLEIHVFDFKQSAEVINSTMMCVFFCVGICESLKAKVKIGQTS